MQAELKALPKQVPVLAKIVCEPLAAFHLTVLLMFSILLLLWTLAACRGLWRGRYVDTFLVCVYLIRGAVSLPLCSVCGGVEAPPPPATPVDCLRDVFHRARCTADEHRTKSKQAKKLIWLNVDIKNPTWHVKIEVLVCQIRWCANMEKGWKNIKCSHCALTAAVTPLLMYALLLSLHDVPNQSRRENKMVVCIFLQKNFP